MSIEIIKARSCINGRRFSYYLAPAGGGFAARFAVVSGIGQGFFSVHPIADGRLGDCLRNPKPVAKETGGVFASWIWRKAAALAAARKLSVSQPFRASPISV